MKTSKIIQIITLFLIFSTSVFAQLGINTDGADPNSSAMLDVKSNNKGVLIPRMTATQKNNIPTPQEGLMVYQTDNPKGFYYYNGSAWTLVGDGVNDADADATNEAQTLSATGTNNPSLSLTQAGGAGGGTVNLVGGTDIAVSRSGNNVTIASTASGGGGGNTTQYIFKPSDQSTTSSSVVNDNSFAFTLEANSTYIMEAELLFLSTGFPDFKTGWSYSGTMNQLSYSTGRELLTSLNESGLQPYGNGPIPMRGLFKSTTAGTLTFQWTTTASPKTLKQNSFMTFTKIQ